METVPKLHPGTDDGSEPHAPNMHGKLEQLEKRVLRLELLLESRQMDRDLRHGDLTEPTRILDYSPEVFESLATRLRANGIDSDVIAE